jgi:hypothetical protein
MRNAERGTVGQSLVTSAATLREEAPPYRTAADSPPSPLGRETAGVRGAPLPPSAFPVPRFIDLFCGIGGFRLAFERAGARCVFSSDWDRFSQQTYAANFGETPHGDIHSVAVGDIPQFDILCGGFPCQPFSLAGVSKKLSLGLNPCGISSHGARPENSAPAKLHHPASAAGDLHRLRSCRPPTSVKARL